MPRIAAARGQPPAIGAEGQALDKAGVSAERDRLRRFGRFKVPNLHGRVPASRGQVAAIGAEGDLPDITSVALQRAEFCVRLRVPVHVPDFHCMIARRQVAAGRCNASAVGADGDAAVRVGIVSHLKARLLCGHGPDLDRGIGSAGRYQERPVGVEGQTRDRGRSRLERMDRLSAGRVVEGDPVVLADSEKLAVWAERDAHHPLGNWNRKPFGQ